MVSSLQKTLRREKNVRHFCYGKAAEMEKHALFERNANKLIYFKPFDLMEA